MLSGCETASVKDHLKRSRCLPNRFKIQGFPGISVSVLVTETSFDINFGYAQFVCSVSPKHMVDLDKLKKKRRKRCPHAVEIIANTV